MIATATKPRILIVDDAPTNIQVLVEILGEAHEIYVATDGLDAQEIALQHLPDLVLLDIEMPGLDGYQVCAKLKADVKTRGIPIIFLTARNAEEDEAKGLKLGAIDYITKPFHPVVVETRVRNQLELKQQRDSLEAITMELIASRNAEEEARRHAEEAKEIAIEASRAKSEFLANMSHEIRTPMNAVIGLADLALQVDMPTKLRDYLTKIANSARSLLRIINDILDFSKIEAGKLELEIAHFLLRDTFDHLADMFRAIVSERQIELILCASEECRYQLHGDALRLEQVLLNLISNAVKFTEEGEIEIQVKTRQESATQVVLEFSVRDTGMGMSEAQVANLFQAFTQADNSTTRKYGGTGLGLSISKRLVEMMGGEIWATSQLGKGSVFYFTVTIPRKFGPEERDMVPPEDMERLKALVVDDNPAARRALQKLLGMFGFVATAVGSGQEALAAIKQGVAVEDPYQLALIDWFMPHMDGIDTTQNIMAAVSRKHAPKIILLHPFGREEKTKTEGDRVGVTAYLTKPVNCSLLFDTTMEVFDKKVLKAFRPGREIVDPTAIIQKIGGARVLLVEDNRINQQVALEVLEAIGLFVDVAADGLEAVTKVDQTVYDVVLMDIQMPDLDGYQATRRIRQDAKHQKLPILAMTAHAMVGDREKCLAAGMNDHVSKPINKRQLYGALMEWIQPRAGIGGQKSETKKGDGPNVPAIPETLAGINVTEALERLNGNRRLLRSLLLEFYRSYAQAGQDIRQALTGGGQEEVKRAGQLLHTVKGMAGNISATQLAAAALALEKTMTQAPTARQLALAAFETALDQVITAISAVKQQADLEENAWQASAAKADGTPLDMDPITHLIKELNQRIEGRAFEAQLVFSKLKPFLQQAPLAVRDDLKQLEESIARIDFKSAQASLVTIAQTLGITLHH